MGEMTTQAPSVAGTMNLLTRLSRVTYRSATPELIGVKLKEFVALTYLRESTRATQQKLAKTLMLDANNCVILLNGLEEEGLIERTRDPEDRRRHIVAITPKGAPGAREGGAQARDRRGRRPRQPEPGRARPAPRALSKGARGPLAGDLVAG